MRCSRSACLVSVMSWTVPTMRNGRPVSSTSVRACPRRMRSVPSGRTIRYSFPGRSRPFPSFKAACTLARMRATSSSTTCSMALSNVTVNSCGRKP